MKKIKYLLWLIILGLLGILIYQNLDYFMTTRALKFDLKIASWNWTIPELQNIAYFGICFLLGLILAGLKGFVVKLRLKKEIKTKDAAAASLKEQVNTLKTELEVFQHDPYIKKEMEEKTIGELPVLDQPENDNEKGDKSDAAG
ncbi:LapA family protein [Desulfobacula sp.]|uniref:LapA family protein n=1 Tax=Desulfobacula sp. TaxID=2593537 RepID=UPI0026340DBE|nr:LapA family protein [Desulfobacula sp.]